MPKNKGFTLVEVMLCMAVIVGVLVGLISLYFYSFDLQETSRNTTIALNAARQMLEEIRSVAIREDYVFTRIVYNNLPYPDYPRNYNGYNCRLREDLGLNLDGILRTTVNYGSDTGDNPITSLIEVTVAACWRQRGGRIIGSATIDGFGNFINCTGSPVRLQDAISKRR